MNTGAGIDREVRFDIIEHIGVLAMHSTGWRKELNIISWNGGTPKFDIRDWDSDHEHMSRGITLHTDEAAMLFRLLAGKFIGDSQIDVLDVDKTKLLAFLKE